MSYLYASGFSFSVWLHYGEGYTGWCHAKRMMDELRCWKYENHQWQEHVISKEDNELLAEDSSHYVGLVQVTLRPMQEANDVYHVLFIKQLPEYIEFKGTHDTGLYVHAIPYNEQTLIDDILKIGYTKMYACKVTIYHNEQKCSLDIHYTRGSTSTTYVLVIHFMNKRLQFHYNKKPFHMSYICKQVPAQFTLKKSGESGTYQLVTNTNLYLSVTRKGKLYLTRYKWRAKSFKLVSSEANLPVNFDWLCN